MIVMLGLLLGCENKENENKESEMQCAAICIAENYYTYTTEMERYLLEASVSTTYGSENISFEYAGTEEEQYGELSGVSMMLTSTGFGANAELELNIETIQINGEDVPVELIEQLEKEECGGTCDSKSFSVSTDDVPPSG